jgi:hypothetical protein
MLVRLAIAALAATVIIGLLIAALAFLSYRDPGNPAMSDVDHTAVFAAWFRRRNAPLPDRELANGGVIVPVREAPEWLRTCAQNLVSPIEGYWQPAAAMILELEARVPAVMSLERRLPPIDRYAGRYAGIVSGGRPLIYGSFVLAHAFYDVQPPLDIPAACGRKPEVFGVTFDIETKTFGELRASQSR